ncbi:MAG: NAD(P)/FAD-dependent oxidoreductase [Solirubrobacterales bacterium]|nr:NAD(P)/FAD-dependent oxidoreductase [Solirubrobacterales bacterium]MBV9472347.1 NAD(P)/FAD-dependent oxidoreductase [Solirubrobacterales bacterium]MBV9837949.1 NAD(P)/FAD-dependent oxidoreductase [Solirubrobacterales bacterium]
MANRFDVAILGAGPAGEHAANALAREGRKVALIEQELIGGECSNWACIPTKTLLRPTELRGESERAAGVHKAALDWPALARYRDYMTSAGDDSGRAEGYGELGVTVLRGQGRLAGRRRLEVAGDRLEAGSILIATGSEAVIPPLDGLADAGYWTNREATALEEIPRSAVVIGGGPVGIELAQFLRRFGSEVALLQGADRLAQREHPRVSELLAEHLRADGVDVRVGVQAKSVRRDGANRVVSLEGGGELHGERLIVAVGRRPRSSGIGLETIGLDAAPRAVPIDQHCRVADGVWAAGDCTGTMLFTHTAKYQARIAMSDMRGRPVPADYRAIPRVIFTDPEVAAVGLTELQAREAGHDVAVARIELPGSIARPYTYEQDPHGELSVIADRDRRVLLGAWAVAPLASEWIHQAGLAIRAEVKLEVLMDTVAQFPSFSEAYLSALQQLEL